MISPKLLLARQFLESLGFKIVVKLRLGDYGYCLRFKISSFCSGGVGSGFFGVGDRGVGGGFSFLIYGV